MSHTDLILQLALQAIDDPDALEVLQDALIERGPNVEVVVQPIKPTLTSDGLIIGYRRGAIQVSFGEEVYAWPLEPGIEYPRDYFAPAIAAVILFRDWPTEWELARRCAFFDPSVLHLTGRWRAQGLDLFAESLFGLQRAPGETDDELRLRMLSRF